MAMDTAGTFIPEEIGHKLKIIEVNVMEAELGTPTNKFDSLTMLNPIHLPQPGTVIGHLHPQHHHEPLPLPKSNKPTGYFPRSSSPTGSVRSSFNSSRRHVSRGSRRSTSFTHLHRSEVSRELTTYAESEFHALMELMSGISRRSSSLKEVWTKIISERESCFSEMDQMYEQFDEYSETIERRERESQQHSHEHGDRKKEVSKLRLDITAALTTVSEYKKKLVERDTELGEARREIAEYKDNFNYLKEEHEETKTTLEQTQQKLVICEEGRRYAEEDAKKHHGELRSLKQQFVELQTSHSELTSKYESTHTEMLSLKQSNTTLRKEKHEWMHEKGELDEHVRKCHHRHDELKRKFKELTESYEKKVRDVHELQETVTKTKYENEELHQKIKELRRELDEEHCRWEDAEE
jgi:chromosome segregation ATPase